MIPKIIHYCWFGDGKKSKLAKKCITSWKKCCPDYEIIEWNETNFDVNMNGYTSYCYENKKWAFLSDYVRLFVVLSKGGIYLDTDVEVIKSFDSLLDNEAFFGFETNEVINTGHGFGAEKGSEVVYKMLSCYNDLEAESNGAYKLAACPFINTQPLLGLGLKLNGEKQKLSDILILPSDSFNPYCDATGILSITDNTFSIHWYNKSWIGKKAKLKSKITRIFHRIFGVNCFDFLKKKK